MKSKAELIVINHTKFGESSIVLHTLSVERTGQPAEPVINFAG